MNYINKIEKLNSVVFSEFLKNTDVTGYIPTSRDVEMAEWVASQITSAGGMLPKKSEEILSLFSEQRSFVLLKSQQIVAHAAISILYPEKKYLEIGSVIVAPENRNKGLGQKVIQGSISLAKLNYPEWQKIALCNEASLPIFVKLGGKIIHEPEEVAKIPDAVWEACSTCPNRALALSRGQICCDTPVSLDNLNF